MGTRFIAVLLPIILSACHSNQSLPDASTEAIRPVVITSAVRHDSDDPAIWLNPDDPSASLVLGTDKDTDGALYVFDLDGQIIEEKTVRGLRRPNNVDLENSFRFAEGSETSAIAVVTEREAESIRVFSVPDMQALDGGGIRVFEGESDPAWRAPMGVAIYRKPDVDSVWVIVGRKSGPTDGSYLWQYLLDADTSGVVSATLVRKFGAFTGGGEIEAIVVDDQLGFVYYCEEGVGVRKYYADPAKGDEELALFGQNDFAEDAEGIAILETSDSTGLIIVSDQQAHAFNVYAREGESGNPHSHTLLRKVYLSTRETDGCEVSSANFGSSYPGGLFVAMSDDKTFQFYDARALLVPDSLKGKR